jgi:hypothetical protein
MYITLPLAVARSRMPSLHAPPAISASLAVVARNWAESLDAVLGFQGLVRPEGDVQEWDARLVGALALLSEVLVGQGMVASELVIEQVRRRVRGSKAKESGGMIVWWEDVVEVGKELYGRVME